jgi:hypothetical protein
LFDISIGWWLAWGACLGAGCASQPVLRNFEAVPAAAEDVDEATDLVSRRHLSNFKLCVQRSRLVDEGGLVGYPMDVVFSLSEDGRASSVKLLSPRFQGTAFAACIMRILTWIRFAPTHEESHQVRLRLYLDEASPLGPDRKLQE